MQKETVNGLVNAYIRDHLSPTPEERELVSSEYAQLCGFVGGTCIQSGSWARFTSTTPVNDLDVIWQIPSSFLSEDMLRKAQRGIDPGDFDPSSVLAKLAETLDGSYKNAGRTVRIVPQSHSVGIYFGEDDEFSIDLVPAIASGHKNAYGDDIYWVPEIAKFSKSRRVQKYASGNPIDWLLSDPRGYIEDARVLNDANEAFRKVAKFVRKWRRGCKSKNGGKFPLKSFHLELVVNKLFKDMPGMNTVDGIEAVFTNLPVYIDAPHFPDRADTSRYVDSYVATLSETEKKAIQTFSDSALSELEVMFSPTSTEDDVRNTTARLLGGTATTASVASASYTTTPSFHPQRSYGSSYPFGS